MVVITYEDFKKVMEIGDKEIQKIGKRRLAEWECKGPWPTDLYIICETLASADNEQMYKEVTWGSDPGFGMKRIRDKDALFWVVKRVE